MTTPLLIVVDDEPDMAHVVQTIGEIAGLESKVATNAMDFQKLILDHQPTVIVMDIVMPDMDGIEQLKWLAEQNCFVPVVLMSGFSGKYIEVASLYGSAKGIPIIGTLTKPFAIDKLQGLLKTLLDQPTGTAEYPIKIEERLDRHESP